MALYRGRKIRAKNLFIYLNNNYFFSFLNFFFFFWWCSKRHVSSKQLPELLKKPHIRKNILSAISICMKLGRLAFENLYTNVFVILVSVILVKK